MATSFLDRFSYAESSNLIGQGGWTSLSSGPITVTQHGLSVPANSAAWVMQTGTILEGDEVEAVIALAITGPAGDSSVAVSFGAAASPMTPGFAARARHSGGVWTLHRTPSPTGSVAPVEWSTGTQVSPMVDAGSSVGVVQELRVRWNLTIGGVRLRAWWNDDIESRPVLDFEYLVGFTANQSASQGFLALFIERGTTDECRVLGVEATVRAERQSESVASSSMFASVAEIVQRAMESFEGRRELPSFPIDRMTSLVADAQQHILQRCGNVAWWLLRTEQLSLTLAWNGSCVLPKRMRNIQQIASTRYRVPIVFTQTGTQPNGSLVVQMSGQGPGTYDVTYMEDVAVVNANSRVSVPREIDRWLVAEVCARMARSHAGNDEFIKRKAIADEEAATCLTWAQQRSHHARTTVMPAYVSRSRTRSPIYGDPL